ncbi:MAG: PQQ-binding-like beta-propeller repeat protein [Thermoproteota archaeon]|nr:PQQ-binding-like beta-propeller repeat protein [Thermoproteota archaeon]
MGNYQPEGYGKENPYTTVATHKPGQAIAEDVVNQASFFNIQPNTANQKDNTNDWSFVNHDIKGTRNSNQTTINIDNVDRLTVKWILNNTYEIQDPPLIIGDKGYVQDYVGNIFSFDIYNGSKIWTADFKTGPSMGLFYEDGIIYATLASDARIAAINATDGSTIWESSRLGSPDAGYSIDSPPLIWNEYLIAGSGGSGLPPGKGLVKGNITALNKTNGQIIWNVETTTGEWVKPGNTPPNGGATAWSGGSIDPETGVFYAPLGSASPNFNSSTRQTPNLYSNHMIAINITSGKILWATPFIAHGTVLDIDVPDTHDWDASWGSSISNVKLENGSFKKIVVGHDKMGNVIAMDALTGKELWWKTLGEQINIDKIPLPNGSGMVWSYGVYNYHAIDKNTLYITATNRGLDFFTDGISGHKVAAPDTMEQGLKNGTIYALELSTGETIWSIPSQFPPRVSPLVTNDILFAGAIPFTGKEKSGIIMALDKKTGEKIWEYNINAAIAPVGPSVGSGMLFVPTDKINDLPKKDKVGGSIFAFEIK